MNRPHASGVKDTTDKTTDQVDGSMMSMEKKKGVKVSGRYVPMLEMERRGTPMPMVQSVVTETQLTEAPTIISIGPSHCGPLVSSDPSNRSDSSRSREGRIRESKAPCTEGRVSKQTVEELKNLLHESAAMSNKKGDEGWPRNPCTYLHSSNAETRQDESSSRSFTTFKPLCDGVKRQWRAGEGNSYKTASSCDWNMSDLNRTSILRSPEEHRQNWNNNRESQTDNSKDNLPVDAHVSQNFISTVEQIKQQVAREDIDFVRFEATDLHGVSRSKTVPARFFHEKAIYGVPMPRSYLELTLSPKINEVDNATPANFSSDVLLIPDLSTFKVLPWADHTARVICDPLSVTGAPLRTSPRIIAKQMLAQLQSMGFSLHSSFTYECCVLGVPEQVGPKTVFFPATTLLSNHDLPFLRQLVNGMYYMGTDVDSFASASGPGQMEIAFMPNFGIEAADSAFTFRTGIKEIARKYNYIASFFTDNGIHNSGVLSHSLWDANGRRSLFHTGSGELSEIGKNWLAGLLSHSAALSCLMAPGISCRNQFTKGTKDQKRVLYASWGCNDNSCVFNVKAHGGREMHVDNRLGSAMANPYIVLAATVAAGLDGIRRGLNSDHTLNRTATSQRQFAIPVKLEDALEALAEDVVLRVALGDPFVQYFIAMKKFEIETQELDSERNKSLEYFI
ncbi:lengsin [Denticeps clupeoides]|uniref:lengsin n=1 Tax=Denticeps clupeoides TaxID=299321 RepID=UPI0010A40268|nr:lengsin [Denticeps clupeoides]